jgi:hypothetical protein
MEFRMPFNQFILSIYATNILQEVQHIQQTGASVFAQPQLLPNFSSPSAHIGRRLGTVIQTFSPSFESLKEHSSIEETIYSYY